MNDSERAEQAQELLRKVGVTVKTEEELKDQQLLDRALARNREEVIHINDMMKCDHADKCGITSCFSFSNHVREIYCQSRYCEVVKCTVKCNN